MQFVVFTGFALRGQFLTVFFLGNSLVYFAVGILANRGIPLKIKP